MATEHPYQQLTMERVMDAVEALGYQCDARNIALNSYENRVYQVGIYDDEGESGTPIIAKFYRPDRWSLDAIKEEHQFLLELSEQDIPVVAPLSFDGKTVFYDGLFYYSVFPRRGGHAPELAREDDLEILGQWLARLHNTGSQDSFSHRPTLDIISDIRHSQDVVLASELMPIDYQASYQAIISDCLEHIQREVSIISETSTSLGLATPLRLHGDMHLGNLMLRDEKLSIVDLDDCLAGPAMQDIWMLLSGSREEQKQQLLPIYEGYQQFRDFPQHELRLIEALRCRRIICHAAWLSKRWSDPAFPIAFPYFASHRYWSDHILALREQLAALQEPPLTIPMP